ncbi:MAG TPA: pectate lyase, partial [Humisphaera sp.]
TEVASHGGYVYKYSADLAKREGEGKTGPDTVWVQPPGTPTVGLAFLQAYERTGEPELLEAAKAAGECLVRGQLRSGGWNDRVEFAPAERARFAYRDDAVGDGKGAGGKKRPFNVSTFDDDKTQAAVRFLVRLDAALKFKDARVHTSVTTALDAICRAQMPSGGWAQGWDAFPDPAEFPAVPASFPETWSRTYQGHQNYWFLATTNDNTIADTVEALLLAAATYDEPRYRKAAAKAGDFIVLAQLPDPQPAWAQQYDRQMRPAWARKFEPPAITGHESQGLMLTLVRLYVETGDRKYLAPVPRALAYLRKSALPDGRLARFYELRTNKPLYMTTAYALTYDDTDLPTHYGFKVANKLDEVAERYERVEKMTPAELAAERNRLTDAALHGKRGRPTEAEVRKLIADLDDRGAWVEAGTLKYHGKGDPTTRIIDSATFAKNLDALARYAGAKD